MRGMAAGMKCMEKLAELEEERIKELEDKLHGQEKIVYERLKEEVTGKNKKTWRKAKLVGAVGILTIVSSLYFTAKGISETNRNLEEQTVAQESNQESLQAYKESRSSDLDYAWLGILSGNAICAAGFSISQYIMGKRAAPVKAYLESHTR